MKSDSPVQYRPSDLFTLPVMARFIFFFSSRNVSKQQHPCIIYLKEMSAVIVEPSQATECNARYCCLQPSVSVFSGIIDGEDLNSHWEGENGGAEGFHLYLRGN